MIESKRYRNLLKQRRDARIDGMILGATLAVFNAAVLAVLIATHVAR